MCQFKSGIILKTRCVVAEGENDSHSDLLEKLNIEDSSMNAMTKFVRVELLPPRDEWWTDPDTWQINVDQDITPDWFDEDQEKYFIEFRAAVKEWWKEHVLVDKKIEELTGGYYRLKRCEVKKLLNDVRVMCDSSTVSEMYGSSTVSRMCGSSTVSEMYGSSTVSRMCGSSTVSEMYGSSTVSRMYGSSTVSEMCGSSTVSEMYGSSTVSRMCDSSTVSRMYGSSTVSEMCGSSTVSRMYGSSTVSRMYGSSTVSEMCDSSTVSRMCDSSTVSEMYGSSTVSRMYGSSIARDYANGKIHISPETNLKIETHSNPKEDKI